MFVKEEVYEQHHPGFSKLPEKKKKKIRQKIKNKISAQQSRDAKKMYISKLEQEIKDLKEENKMLRSQLEKNQ